MILINGKEEGVSFLSDFYESRFNKLIFIIIMGL